MAEDTGTSAKVEPPSEALMPRRIPGNHGGTLTPFPKGKTGNPAGYSKERREFYSAIEKHQLPKALRMLDALYERGIDGDDVAAKLWLDQVRGPVKPRPEDEVEQAVEAKLLAMLEEARRRKALELAATKDGKGDDDDVR